MTLAKTMVFAPDHPAFAGHFPGRPIVPGALLLDAAIELAARHGVGPVAGILAAKFIAPLAPGQECRFVLEAADEGGLRLTCSADGAVILAARLACRPRRPA